MPPNFLDQPTRNTKRTNFLRCIDFHRTVTATQKFKLISARTSHP
jgi:hypothetical protein